MAPRTNLPINRDPPTIEKSLPVNLEASGSQIHSVMLTPEALEQIIDCMHRNSRDFISFDPPAFDGSSDDIDVAYEWIMDLESIFDMLQFQDEQRVRSAVFRMKGHARNWWNFGEPAQVDGDVESTISWQEFKDMFFEQYCPETVKEEKEMEFLNLKQGNMTVYEYERQFLKLCRFAQELVDTPMKMARRFVMGLRNEIKGLVALQGHTDYSSASHSARILDKYMPGRAQPGQDAHGSPGQKRKHLNIS